FKLGVKIDAITDNSVEIINKEGKKVSILSDKILVATGRKPNTAGLGLENTNIQLGQRGEIVVNDKLETTVQNVWALGD
ncbi:FAD-dependent oxidoreductase, partial [Staphylococcus saprophyticus]